MNVGIESNLAVRENCLLNSSVVSLDSRVFLFSQVIETSRYSRMVDISHSLQILNVVLDGILGPRLTPSSFLESYAHLCPSV